MLCGTWGHLSVSSLQQSSKSVIKYWLWGSGKAYNKLPSVCGTCPWIDNITPLLLSACGLYCLQLKIFFLDVYFILFPRIESLLESSQGVMCIPMVVHTYWEVWCCWGQSECLKMTDTSTLAQEHFKFKVRSPQLDNTFRQVWRFEGRRCHRKHSIHFNLTVDSRQHVILPHQSIAFFFCTNACKQFWRHK